MIADSKSWKVWIKNIWVKQAETVSSWASSQKIPSIVGKVKRDRARSEAASMARKRYIGTRRVRSLRITVMMVTLPARVMKNMVQKGMEIQMCTVSSPGMPVTRKVEKMALVLLVGNRMPALQAFPRMKVIVSLTDVKIWLEHLTTPTTFYFKLTDPDLYLLWVWMLFLNTEIKFSRYCGFLKENEGENVPLIFRLSKSFNSYDDFLK